ncbi:MAG: TerB family tellurite resistance protein [Pirellulaceae bacterium]|nr:TerB family tellurite resistance protein [Pirellulaceae bacterium]
MLVMGSMEWASTIERGEFFCPKCNATKSYQRKIARPFLTLYFVPIIPIGGLREFVICRGCRDRYDPSVLVGSNGIERASAAATAATMASFDMEILRLMALMIVEDDYVTEAEIQMAMRVYQGMMMQELPRSELERACREVVALRINASRYVGIAAQGMTYDQKLKAVQAMFAVAGAEGQISPKRLKSLMDAQKQLGLDDVAFQSAVKDATAWVA